MGRYQIWPCHVTHVENLSFPYLKSYCPLNFRKSHQILWFCCIPNGSYKEDNLKEDRICPPPPCGIGLNKIMANSVWGKWTQNPSGQQEIKMCNTIRDYHECLRTGCVKRVSLVSDRLLQVELELDRGIDGENRERQNCRTGLGRKNVTVGAFVTAASRDLMYFRYLSKLKYDQLLYTDTDSVIVYQDSRVYDHVVLPTSDLLGDLKDEYGDVLRDNPTWYIDEVIAFGPKMYHLIIRDKDRGVVVKWDKTMKGISLRGNITKFSTDKLPLYRNPVLEFCCVLQDGSSVRFSNMKEVWDAMHVLKCKRMGVDCRSSSTISVPITLSQSIFKRELAKVFTDNFILSKNMKKRIHVTQCKRFPKPDRSIPLGITYPIGWC